MRVFVLGNNFIIGYTASHSGLYFLVYVAVNIHTPITVLSPTIVDNVAPHQSVNWDGFVVNDALFLAYYTTSGGNQVKVGRLDQNLVLTFGPGFSTAPHAVSLVSVTADITLLTNPVIYVTYFESTTGGYTVALNTSLVAQFSPVLSITDRAAYNLSTAAVNGICYIYEEIDGSYSFGTPLITTHIDSYTVSATGATTPSVTTIRSVGLASKAFVMNSQVYFLSAYSSAYQPTYFLINGSASVESSPNIVAKLAYQNGGGLLSNGLPSVTVIGNTAQVSYLYKDLIQAVNKNTNPPSGSQINGIYSQTGINQCSFTFSTAGLDTAEIGNNLHLSGGFLGMYDGYFPFEHNFFLYPDIDPTPPYPMNLIGSWDASANTPALADGAGTLGATYRISTSGNRDLGNGTIT
jgi:hypothetical protein